MSVMGQELVFSMNGTYEAKEKNLSITVKDIAVQKAPEQFKAMIEEGMKKQTGKTQTGTITWDGEDKFTLAEGGKQQPFTRKK